MLHLPKRDFFESRFFRASAGKGTRRTFFLVLLTKKTQYISGTLSETGQQSTIEQFKHKEKMKKHILVSSTVLGILSLLATANREIQQDEMVHIQTLPYRATYKADFQHLMDPYCFIGDSPTLIVTCYGENMTLLGTSHESIKCLKMNLPLVENGTSFECVNTCTSETTPPCTSVYMASDESIDGPFGSINYICESRNFAQVDSFFMYKGGTTNGTCVTSSSIQSRNFHIGRLGILCPTNTWTNMIEFDDTGFECHSVGSFVADISNDPNDDIYACVTGSNCNGKECEVVFSDFYIHSKINQINQCVETLGESSIVVPTTAPIDTTSTHTFTARFEASWAQLYDSTSSHSFCTINDNPSMIVTCGSGSSITFVRSTDTFMNCTKSISSHEMTCVTSDINNILDQFTSVFYVSSTFLDVNCSFFKPPLTYFFDLDFVHMSHTTTPGVCGTDLANIQCSISHFDH